MGREFGRFSIDPEVHRHAEHAHALRTGAMAETCRMVARSVQGFGATLISTLAHERKQAD